MGDVIEVPGITEQRLRILAEIAQAYNVRYQRDFEFTRAEFMAETGARYTKASRLLDDLVASGELRSALANVNGRQTLVYWRPEDEL